jgi:L-malate glycosyltransferase
LQEAMASGIVPVVLNNPTEKTLVKHMENGLVANDLDEYVKYIELLYNDKILRQKLSKNAKKYAKEIFSLENLTNQWNKVFDEVLNFPKTIKKWDIKNNNPSYFEVFLESLGEYKHLFMVQSEKDLQRIKELAKFPNWQSQTKGTAHQYHDFFKNDEELKKISKLMKEN